jgi:hypothetical protein
VKKFKKYGGHEMKKFSTILMLLSMASILTVGCVTPLTNSGVSYSGSSALVNRPDFDAARLAAPSWVNAALNENTNLRAEIKELKASK